MWRWSVTEDGASGCVLLGETCSPDTPCWWLLQPVRLQFFMPYLLWHLWTWIINLFMSLSRQWLPLFVPVTLPLQHACQVLFSLYIIGWFVIANFWLFPSDSPIIIINVVLLGVLFIVKIQAFASCAWVSTSVTLGATDAYYRRTEFCTVLSMICNYSNTSLNAQNALKEKRFQQISF
jgi:hypothetical protein